MTRGMPQGALRRSYGREEKPRVLITGSRSFPALFLVRNFGAAGYEVFSADSRPRTVAEKSRYVQQHFLLPPPAEDPAANVGRVAGLVGEHGIGLIVPTCEEGLFLSEHRDLLPLNSRLFSDSIRKLEALHNKFTFSLICPEFGARSPETHLLRMTEDLKVFMDGPEAWVFKPIFSRFSAFTLISPTREELNKVTILPGNPWVAQERVFGREYSCYGIAQEGRLVAFSSYETPYRLGQGGGVYLVNRSHHTPRLLAFMKRVVEGFAYTGQIAFDFMEDEAGELWAIECNPAFDEWCVDVRRAPTRGTIHHRPGTGWDRRRPGVFRSPPHGRDDHAPVLRPSGPSPGAFQGMGKGPPTRKGRPFLVAGPRTVFLTFSGTRSVPGFFPGQTQGRERPGACLQRHGLV